MGLRVWGLGFRAWGLGYRVWGIELKVWGLGSSLACSGGFRICGTGLGGRRLLLFLCSGCVVPFPLLRAFPEGLGGGLSPPAVQSMGRARMNPT